MITSDAFKFTESVDFVGLCAPKVTPTAVGKCECVSIHDYLLICLTFDLSFGYYVVSAFRFWVLFSRLFVGHDVKKHTLLLFSFVVFLLFVPFWFLVNLYVIIGYFCVFHLLSKRSYTHTTKD